MEANEGNVILKISAEVIAKANPKMGKPPTRLQKKAPSSLELNNSSSSSSFDPIPLLSPLILSPLRHSNETDDFKFPIAWMNDKNIETPVLGGWKRPAAVSGYIEPSSLFSFFQSKCVLVGNNVN
ncbi:uncharacterized protein LOC126666348 [Mercurialis annua]|uniref:uncharacterized protein LOC126666348 n=1 Tax=Mercurialis annua TaxID=3986 RepID=UPI00215F650F|nr:uncharacterized protein LOC126666348 [Mercurialis annua]